MAMAGTRDDQAGGGFQIGAWSERAGQGAGSGRKIQGLQLRLGLPTAGPSDFRLPAQHAAA
jgi:hypothetical protein